MIRYLSLFSGAEAATLAWEPLGWQPVAFAEIEPAPARLLAHRWPHVLNLGDVTNITEVQIAALGRIDLVVGGSPCQDLSVAGKRAGLSGARSSLFHHQLRIFDAARTFCGARWLVWENVPGAFSSNRGADFATVVSAMAGCSVSVPRKGWGTEGVALGRNGLVEWGVLDAQWFGVAQRRRRVFAVLDTGDWASRAPILLEPESLRGNSAPSREAGQSVAGTISARTQGGGGLGTDFELDGELVAFGGNNCSGPIDVATARNACSSGSGRMDFETETFVVHGTQDPIVSRDLAHALQRNNGGENVLCVTGSVMHALTAEGFNASEDGTGRGNPIVAFAIQAGATRLNPESGPDGVGVQADIAYTLEARAEVQCVAFQTRGSNLHVGDISGTIGTNSGSAAGSAPCVAFSCKDSGADAGEIAPTLRAMGHSGSHANAGGQVAVASGQVVRRLTPLECERLQGFPDSHTAVPDKRGQPMKDGPRYKIIGNSMAVPCMRWIGQQIQRASESTGNE